VARRPGRRAGRYRRALLYPPRHLVPIRRDWEAARKVNARGETVSVRAGAAGGDDEDFHAGVEAAELADLVTGLALAAAGGVVVRSQFFEPGAGVADESATTATSASVIGANIESQPCVRQSVEDS
jgi:hypothetical protein